MTAVTFQTVQLDSDESPTTELTDVLNDDEDHHRRQHKKKSKEERRKRSRSYSTDASICSTASKKRKKKKKHHRRSLDEPPSPKVNPIFLWVKEDNAKIVEVRCEDYDRRNRIKLTKTAGGWRAIPHVQINQWLSSPSEKRFKMEEDDPPAPKLEPELFSDCSLGACDGNSRVKTESEQAERKCDTPPPQLEKCPSESDIPMLEDGNAGGERSAPKLEPNVDIVQETCELEVQEEESDAHDVHINEEQSSDKLSQNRRQVAEAPQTSTEDTSEMSAEIPAEEYDAHNLVEPASLVADDETAADTKESNIQIDDSSSERKVNDDEQSDIEASNVSAVNSAPHSPNSFQQTDENTNDHAANKEESTHNEIELCSNDNCVSSPLPCKSGQCEQFSGNDEALPEGSPAKEALVEGALPKETLQEETLAQDALQENLDGKQECAIKCCEEAQSNNVDENHNNEFDSDSRQNCMNIEPSNFCQDIEDILGAIENQPQHKPEGSVQQLSHPNCSKDVDEYDHNALMTELEEMMNERMKNDHSSHKDVLDDIYTFVPSPSHTVQEKSKSKEAKSSKIERVIEQVKAKSACAMLAKVSSSGHDRTKSLSTSQPQMKSCDLDNLDLLWRLPEGTTIHHSKPSENKDLPIATTHQSSCHEEPCPTATISLVKPTTPVSTAPTYQSPHEPVQEEPLNLGKPRRPSQSTVTAPSRPPSIPQLLKKEVLSTCKLETKPQLPHSHQADPDLSRVKPMPKGAERCTPDSSKPLEPLAQLKEIMSDPEVTVPDPLLVPKERLSALIANPKREIPRLMALTNEVKYPKLDTNLMEVSLAHLQLLLQSSKKEDELKLIQKHADLLQSHLKNDSAHLDPATMNALNQMLWFPYLSHLDMGRSANPQDVMGMMNMMFPYNAWSQQAYDYAQQSHLINFWQDMSQKPNMSAAPQVSKGYSDLYKPIPPVISPSLYTSASSLESSRVLPTASYPSRTSKHSSSRRHHRAETVMPPPPPLIPASATDFLKSPAFDLSSWSLPQTSEASRVSSTLSHYKFPPRSEASAPPSSCSQTQVSSSETPPKLKVRKFDVDPNAVPKLINKNLASPVLPPLSSMARQVPSHYYDANHLWNPLYASQSRESDYTSSGHWNWTTPVTVSNK